MSTRFLLHFFMTVCGQANQCVNTFELVFQVEEICTNSSCCLIVYIRDSSSPFSYISVIFLGVPTPTTYIIKLFLAGWGECS
jgi:hypothetical protein